MVDTDQGVVPLLFTSSFDVSIGWFPVLVVADSATATFGTSNVTTEYIQREGRQISQSSWDICFQVISVSRQEEGRQERDRTGTGWGGMLDFQIPLCAYSLAYNGNKACLNFSTIDQ